MIVRPRRDDIKNIGYYLGRIIMGIGVTMLVPAVIGLAFGEWDPVVDFLIAFALTMIFGLVLSHICYNPVSSLEGGRSGAYAGNVKDLTWMQGMIIVALSWIVAMLLGAIPLYLSTHWKSYLDACFDAMSGFATTGLILVQDLDHLSRTHNLWRHLIMFIGGQGIVIIALSFLVKGASGAFRMYVGEGRDEKIMPNVIHTSRFIWLVSLVYLVLGTLALGITGIANGMKPVNSFFHGACIFMAAFDTGGFAPQSQNILYYHSFPYELITVVLMFLGALNFKLHYHLWIGNRREIYRNIETVTLFVSLTTLFFIAAAALSRYGIYPKALILFRKGFYQLVSAHTGTGYQTIYGPQFLSDWSPLAMVAAVCAMGLGGAVCSTTGAIKMLRIGIIGKAFLQDINRIILPEKAVVVQKLHHINKVFIEDKQVRLAFLITLSYLVLYAVGAMVGMWLGYPFLNSLFESTSAAANVGLSCGITDVSMPALLKYVYIFQMWIGRLEFMAVFTLIGFIIASIKGK
jgi:trk system potassium uptake protein TrkH